MPGLPAKEMLKPENLFAKSGKHSPSRLILSGLVLLSLFAGIFSFFSFSSGSSDRVFPSPIHALAASQQEESDSFEIIYRNINDILIWKIETEGASDLQDLIDTSLAGDPISGTNQNYITSIIQNPYIDADLSKYITSLGIPGNGPVIILSITAVAVHIYDIRKLRTVIKALHTVLILQLIGYYDL